MVPPMDAKMLLVCLHCLLSCIPAQTVWLKWHVYHSYRAVISLLPALLQDRKLLELRVSARRGSLAYCTCYPPVSVSLKLTHIELCLSRTGNEVF